MSDTETETTDKPIVTHDGLKCLLKRQFDELQKEVKEAEDACNDLESQTVYVDDNDIEDAIEIEPYVKNNRVYASEIEMPKLGDIKDRMDTLGRLISQIDICEDHGPTTITTHDDNGGQIKTETCEISRVWYRIDKLIDVVEAFERRHDSWCQRLAQAMADRASETQSLKIKVDLIWDRVSNLPWKPGDGQD